VNDAVTLVVPTPTAVTFPPLTVATLELDTDQDTACPEGVVVAVNVEVLLGYRDRDDTFSETLGLVTVTEHVLE
jgi:hypothetical protein